MAPGAVVPLHEHTALEQTYVLKGTLEDHEGVCGPGQFVWRPAGNQHEAVAPNGAVILGQSSGGSGAGAAATGTLNVNGTGQMTISPVAAPGRVVITATVIAVCAALVFSVWYRRNQFVGRLSAPTMAVAKIERKFQRRRHDQWAAFTIGAPVAIWILGAVASFVVLMVGKFVVLDTLVYRLNSGPATAVSEDGDLGLV